MLEMLNAAFTTAILIGLVVILLVELRRKPSGFSPKALRFLLTPLLIAMILWTVEYWLVIADILQFEKWLNLAVSVGFFLSGWFLLHQSGDKRIHNDLPPSSSPGPRRIFLRRVLGSIPILIVVPLGMVLSPLWEHGGKYAAFTGLVVLGCGLLDELTKRTKELIGFLSGGSLIAYGFFQVFQEITTKQWSLYVFSRVMVVVWKVMFLVAILSFWTMIGQTRRVAHEERERSEIDKRRRELEEEERRQKLEKVYAHFHDIAFTKLDSIEAELGRLSDKTSDPLALRMINDMLVTLREIEPGIRRAFSGQMPTGVSLKEVVDIASMRLLRYKEINLQVRNKIHMLPKRIEHYCLGPIAREALKNIEKHAPLGDQAKMTIWVEDDKIIMTIENDGTISLPNSHGQSDDKLPSGLAYMRKIADEYGASFKFISQEGGGATARIEVSL